MISYTVFSTVYSFVKSHRFSASVSAAFETFDFRHSTKNSKNIDTTFYSDYYRDLNAKGLVNQFAIRYTDANRKAIKQQYKNAEAFEKNFAVTNQMVDDLVALAEKEGVKLRPEGLERSRATIENVVKAIVARDVYGDDDLFFRILNSNNDIYREALRLIQSPDYDRLLSAPQQ